MLMDRPRGPTVTECPDASTRAMGRACRVYLIEDNRLVRDGVVAALRSEGFEVAGAARAGDEALSDLGRSGADVVLVDAGIPECTRLIGKLRSARPDAAVVVMNFHAAHADAVAFIRAGVAGFILKDATAGDVGGTIRRVADGAPALPRELGRLLYSHVAAQGRLGSRREARSGARLTSREREIVALIADGLSNKEIAAQLSVEVNTVKSHVHSVLEKLQLRTRLEVAAYAHAR